MPCAPLASGTERLYDKSAKDKSANDTSAKPTVRMPTVRMRQECECQMCECQQCDATSVRKKCDRCANDNSAKRTLCRDMHALRYRLKPEFWDRQSHFSPLITPSLTITWLKYPYPHPNPRTKTVWRVIRIDFHVHLFFDDLLGSVTLPLPQLTWERKRETERERERVFFFFLNQTPSWRPCGFALRSLSVRTSEFVRSH